jgi:signal transduction histidine kinase
MDEYENIRTADIVMKSKGSFINIAAQWLRTPIQPILGLSQVLQSRIKNRVSGIIRHNC